MTKQEWLSCNDPLAMLRIIHPGRTSGRKFRLFAAACSRDLLSQGLDPEEETLPQEYRFETAILEAEVFADGQGLLTNRGGWNVALPVCDAIGDKDVAYSVLGYDADSGNWVGRPEEVVPKMIRRYRTHPAHHLRDIFGSLFRTGPFDLACRGPVVVSLAQAAYDQRILPIGHLDPARLAVLSDALEDAGCTDAELLGHLRDPGPHVRGCWALDLVLSKDHGSNSL
jgi:hypothetical protein